MKYLILRILSLSVFALLLTGCYETEFPVLNKGEKVNIAGSYIEKNQIDGSAKKVTFTEHKEGVWPFVNYSYIDSRGEVNIFKKLSSGLYLVQQKEKKKGNFSYAFVDFLDDKTVLMLVPDFMGKGAYIDTLLKKYEIKSKSISHSVVTILRLKSSKKNILAFLESHDKSILTVVLKFEKQETTNKTNSISSSTSNVMPKLNLPSAYSVSGDITIKSKDEQKTYDKREKKHPHYQLCKAAEALGGHEPYYIPFRATSNLNVRNKPSVESRKIGLIKKGTKVEGECIKFDVLNSKVSGYWIYIGGMPGEEKYVFSHYLKPLKSEARDNSNVLKRTSAKEKASIPKKFLGQWDKDATKCFKESRSSLNVEKHYINYWSTSGVVRKNNIIDKNSIELIVTMFANERDEKWRSKVSLNLNKSFLTVKHDKSKPVTYVRCE